MARTCWVARRLLEEELDAGGEGVVWMVQQDVPLADNGDDVRLAGGLLLGKAPSGLRHELRLLEVVPVQADEGP
jgi:hypothetical protein